MFKDKACGICGKTYTPIAPSQKYCCEECKVVGKKIAYDGHLSRLRSGVGSGGANKKGKEHPQYKTGKGFLNSNRVHFRDTVGDCECCGKDLRGMTGRNSFCIHHRDHNPKNNPEDFSNWELLCPRCHHNTHNKHEHLNVQRLAERRTPKQVETGDTQNG